MIMMSLMSQLQANEHWRSCTNASRSSTKSTGYIAFRVDTLGARQIGNDEQIEEVCLQQAPHHTCSNMKALCRAMGTNIVIALNLASTINGLKSFSSHLTASGARVAHQE